MSACCVFIVACSAVDSIRHSYMSGLRTRAGLPWCIRRSHVYDDVIKMHRENSAQILGEYPFCVRFDGEKAVDTGGVCRDMYSSFWESACLRHFNGENLLIPAVNPNTDMSTSVRERKLSITRT